MLLIQTVVETDFCHVPSSLSIISTVLHVAFRSTLYNKRQRRSHSACPAECLPFPPLPLTIWTYVLVTGLFAQLVWFSLSVVLISLAYPIRENVFFKRKAEGAGAGLTRKNVRSVQSPSLCKGKAAKSRSAQALCPSNTFGVSNHIAQARLCI